MNDLPLHDYQCRAIEFCEAHRQAYLAVDMGLGKTRVSLELMRRNKRKALVIAPLRGVLSTWPQECKKWTPELTCVTLHGTEKTTKLRQDADLYIINPEGMKWLYKELQKIYAKSKTLPFTELIVDEGSMWKSSSTKRFDILKTLLPIFKDFKIILSGTPAPNSLMDLWSQYYLLDFGQALCENFYRFRSKFFHPVDYQGFQFGLNDGAERQIYERIAPRTFRLDAKDYLDMPDIIYNAITVEMPDSIKKRYKQLEDQFFIEFDEGRIDAFNAASLSTKLRQFIQGGLYYLDTPGEDRLYQPIHKVKLQALQDLVLEHTNEPILCAIQFRFELDMLLKAFPDTPAIVGGCDAKVSAKYIDLWNRGDLPLLICHPASLSHSVNLQTGGHIVLWYGLSWSLEKYQQLNARLYRQGQQHAVIIHHLVMQDTIDEVVMQALERKDKTQASLLNYLKEYHNGQEVGA